MVYGLKDRSLENLLVFLPKIEVLMFLIIVNLLVVWLSSFEVLGGGRGSNLAVCFICWLSFMLGYFLMCFVIWDYELAFTGVLSMGLL